MKKTLIIFALSLICLLNYSQTINDIPIKDVDVDYMLIVGTSTLNPLNNKVTINVDFGQENKIFSAKDTQLKDENGILLKFNSMIDALNFWYKNGYEFVNAYTITMGNQNVYHFLMKKIK
jgi:hypothetical protein